MGKVLHQLFNYGWGTASTTQLWVWYCINCSMIMGMGIASTVQGLWVGYCINCSIIMGGVLNQLFKDYGWGTASTVQGLCVRYCINCSRIMGGILHQLFKGY